MDGLYAAMGLGYFARCAMERAQWGAGHLSRSYEHQGDSGKSLWLRMGKFEDGVRGYELQGVWQMNEVGRVRH